MSLFDIYQNNNSSFSSINDNENKNFNLIDNFEKKENSSLIEKYNNQNDSIDKNGTPFYYQKNISPLETYKKEAFFETNNIASIFNVRGKNYQELSIIDKMRGIQANRLNLDTKDLSIAEIYADEMLDNRTMNGLYNITLTDTYKDKKLFNAYHGLFTDGILTEIEDTQDIGITQKTYSELEEENVFFTKEKEMDYNIDLTKKHIYSTIYTEKENKTESLYKTENYKYENTQIKKTETKTKNIQKQINNNNYKSSYYSNNNTIKKDNLSGYEEESFLIISLKDSNNENILFKNNEIYSTSFYLKDSTSPIENFYKKKENNLIDFYKQQNINFKSNRAISSASQFQNSWNKEKSNSANNTFHKKNPFIFKENKKNKNLNSNNNNSFRLNQLDININNKSLKKQSSKFLNLDNSSILSTSLFNDSKKIDFEEEIRKEKEKNKKILKLVFKETATKLEVLSKTQLQNILNELKIKQQKAKQDKAILKYLKIETKIKAIENYINSLKDF